LDHLKASSINAGMGVLEEPGARGMMVDRWRPERTDSAITLYPNKGVPHESTVIIVQDCEQPGNEVMALLYDEDEREHHLPKTSKIIIPIPPLRKLTQFDIIG
jgi:hypothetical protein